MIDNIYGDWLKIAPVLYIAFGIFALCVKVPNGIIYKNFNISRKYLGLLLISMGAYIGSLGIFDFSHGNTIPSISYNLISYFGSANIGEIMCCTLLSNNYFSRHRVKQYTIKWLIYTLLVLINSWIVPPQAQNVVIIILSALLIAEVVRVVVTFFKTYNAAKKSIDNYYAESFSLYMRWIEKSVYMLIAIAFFGCTHAYYPPIVNFIYGIVSAAMFTYMLISYQNYMVYLGELKDGIIIDEEATETSEPFCSNADRMHERLNEWIYEKKFTQKGLTIDEIAAQFSSNRAYLSNFINNNYNVSFREWIIKQRIAYSKELLRDTKLHINEIASIVGYTTNTFTYDFLNLEGITPSMWRDINKVETITLKQEEL